MVRTCNKEFVGYTYAICPVCGDLWSIFDKKGEFNDEFPRRKCPNCKAKTTRKINKERVENGKPKLSEVKKRKPRKLTPAEKFIKENNITDKLVIKEFKSILKRNSGKRVSYTRVLKDAKEIVSYKLEDNKEI